VIREKEKCTDKCSNDDIYKYEYNNICYKECPKTSIISKIDNFLCEPLICKKYYNFEKTECLEYIPEGYFLNNSDKGIIDKCHQNCKTCSRKEVINSTNCDSCLNNKYLDIGNCVDKCPNNYIFEDKYNNSNILRCKCSYNKKCSLCSFDILKYDLCLACNNDEGFYPKENDETNNNSYINCYKNIEGYYLDSKDNIYKKCYPTCKKCNKPGNKTNNNCIECISTYIFKEDYENDFNCYQNCLYFYYFDLIKIIIVQQIMNVLKNIVI